MTKQSRKKQWLPFNGASIDAQRSKKRRGVDNETRLRTLRQRRRKCECPRCKS